MNLFKHSKKLLVFSAILLITQQSFGQSSSRKGLYVSPMLSVGIGSATGENFIESIEDGVDNIEEGGVSYAIGANATYMFNDKIGVMAGLAVRHYSGDPYYNNAGMRMDLEIPLYFRYITSKANKIGFFINTGFTPAFMIASDNAYSNSYYNYNVNTSSSSTVQNTVNLSFGLNFGINIPLGRLGNIDIGPELHAGLVKCGEYYSSNYYSSSYYNSYGSEYPLRTGYLGLRVQYNFQIIK